MRNWITGAAMAVALVGFAAQSSASPLTSICSALMNPNNQAGVSGSTCTVTADPGFFISGLTLTASDDVTGVFGGVPTLTFSATLVQSGALFSIPTYCGGLTSGLPCADTVVGSPASGLNLTTYSVQSTNAFNTVSGTGGIAGASIVMTLTATETRSTVPEPMTFSLMGAGLLGLGLLRKRVSRS